MPIPSGPNYPSLESILNNVRAIVNDAFAGWTSTPGEGQIVTDYVGNTTVNNPLTLNFLNSSIRELYRKMRNVKTPTLIQDNFILSGLDIISGPMGEGIPDPGIQTYLDNTGYWYGQSYDNSFTLPTDMLFPLVLWERTTGSNDPFSQMSEAANGLASRYQTSNLQDWEWRTDRLNFNGALQQRDLRIRYAGVFPQFFTPDLDYEDMYVPILDCEDYVAYTTAKKVAMALGNAQIAQALEQQATGHLFDIQNEQVRRMQHKTYRRKGFDDANQGDVFDVYGM